MAMASADRKMVSMLEKVLAEVRSGLVSSVVAEAALFPLDVVKLRQQVHGGSAMQILRGVLHNQGVAGLYKGLIGRLIQTITSNVGFFVWQTIALQTVSQRLAGQKLGTGLSLVVNMLAQQFNRLLTNPVDVVANVNQADPNSKGFLRTFVYLARTGGRATLWRGLPVALLLSLNPALMFTLVGKLSVLVKKLRHSDADDSLAAADMFWISGVSKAIATLVTYPLIRAKARQQTLTSGDGITLGLWATLAAVFQAEGMAGLYSGVWMLSYKTVLFNSMMMSLKQQFRNLEERWRPAKPLTAPADIRLPLSELQKKVVVKKGLESPWEAAAKGASVVYIDGSWNYLHEAQEHVIRRAAQSGDYLIVGVHDDETHKEEMGSWPKERFADRVARLHKHHLVSAVLENAPWHVSESLLDTLAINTVISGSLTKLYDCADPDTVKNAQNPENPLSPKNRKDPYDVPKRRESFVLVPSLNNESEHHIWIKTISRILWSNVDASIDWRILVPDDVRKWGENPGYQSPPRAFSPTAQVKSRSVPRKSSSEALAENSKLPRQRSCPAPPERSKKN
jgi:glycerol-3-phosphate cytidylyltransferase-like family protein